MNISRKIILPAVSVILISWLDLNAKANTDKVQPQRSTDTAYTHIVFLSKS